MTLKLCLLASRRRQRQISIEGNNAGTHEHAGDHHIHAGIAQDEAAPQGAGECGTRFSTVHVKTMEMTLSAHIEGIRVKPIVIHTYMELKYKTCDSR